MPMFDRQRSHLQLQMDILEVIAVVRHEPYLITQIQQLTQMSTGQIKRYLVEMATKGLLTVELMPHARVARKEYKITANGLILLHMWQEFKKTWDVLLVAKTVNKVRNDLT